MICIFALQDREPKMALQYKGGMDEDFSGRIKNMEDKLRGATPTDKKPRDLLRAIGKVYHNLETNRPRRLHV